MPREPCALLLLLFRSLGFSLEEDLERPWRLTPEIRLMTATEDIEAEQVLYGHLLRF